MQFKSVTLQKYVSAENGGGSDVSVSRDIPSTWETFRVLFAFIITSEFRLLFLHTFSRFGLDLIGFLCAY